MLSAIRGHPEYGQFADLLVSICNLAKKLDEDFTNEAEEIQSLQAVIVPCSELAATISRNRGSSLGKASENKYIKQVEKLGRYRDLCAFLAKMAARYPDLFKNITLKVIPPYSPTRSSISVKGRTVDCFVHAEIQLVTFYATTSNLVGGMPRVFGVSKFACYLCDMFIRFHGQFIVSKTHGRLYDQWAVPDLGELRHDQLLLYRDILGRMDEEVRIRLGSPVVRRQWPLESSYNLLDYPCLSSVASSTKTSASQVTIRASTLKPTPRATAIEAGLPLDPRKEPDNAAVYSIEHLRDSPRATQSMSFGGDAEGSISANQPLDAAHSRSTVEKVEAGAAKSSTDQSIEDNDHLSHTSIQTSRSTTEPSPMGLPSSPHRSPTRDPGTPVVLGGMRIHFQSDHFTKSVATRLEHLGVDENAIDVDALAPGEVIDLVRERFFRVRVRV